MCVCVCFGACVCVRAYETHVDVIAKYTVRVYTLMLTNCVHANDNSFDVRPHIILYLSARRPETIDSTGRVTPSFPPSRMDSTYW